MYQVIWVLPPVPVPGGHGGAPLARSFPRSPLRGVTPYGN